MNVKLFVAGSLAVAFLGYLALKPEPDVPATQAPFTEASFAPVSVSAEH